MELQVVNDTDEQVSSEQPENEEGIASAVQLVGERVRKEITAIVRKENELNRKKHKRIVNGTHVFGVDDESSDNDEDMDDEDKRALIAFKLNQKARAKKNALTISRKKALDALNFLKKDVKTTKRVSTSTDKRFAVLKKYCTATRSSSKLPTQSEHTWDSPMYIIKAIRASVLTRNWNNATRLLLLLLKHKDKRYVSYAKQVTQLVLMNSPADCRGEFLEEFSNLFAVGVNNR